MTDQSHFYKNIFRRIPGPMYVIDLSTQNFNLVNPAFAALMGGDRSDFENKSAKEFVVDEDWDNILNSLKQRESDKEAIVYRFRALTRDGRQVPLEVSGIQLESPWENFEIGVVKDLRQEKKLESEVARERENTLRAFQSTARIWHITDMIRAAFNAMELLAKAQSVDDLLEEAIELLTSSKGLDFKCATIYLQESRRLSVAKSAGDTSARSINLDKNGRLARIFKGNELEEDMKGQDKVIVLRGPKKTIGLLRVIEHDNIDNELVTESIQRLRDSVLRTFCNTLSLLIRNIQLYKKIEEQSIVDPLTKVFNRRYFVSKFREELERASRYLHPLGVILLDIDYFKKINDDYGHLQGDKILEEIGNILNKRVRETDVVCRYGGEEFIVVLPETELDVACKVAEEIREMVQSFQFKNVAGSDPMCVTVSIGVSCFFPKEKRKIVSQEILIADADQALYQAKESGRNQVVKGNQISV